VSVPLPAIHDQLTRHVRFGRHPQLSEAVDRVVREVFPSYWTSPRFRDVTLARVMATGMLRGNVG
jgi:hypothetical protein